MPCAPPPGLVASACLAGPVSQRLSTTDSSQLRPTRGPAFAFAASVLALEPCGPCLVLDPLLVLHSFAQSLPTSHIIPLSRPDLLDLPQPTDVGRLHSENFLRQAPTLTQPSTTLAAFCLPDPGTIHEALETEYGRSNIPPKTHPLRRRQKTSS